MISVTIRYNNTRIDMEFPCTDSCLQEQLVRLRGNEVENSDAYIEKVTEPKSLSILNNHFINMDELNYFAKRMESLDNRETMQFYAVATQCKLYKMKDLINLTFNLPCYTLIQDFSSMEKVGRIHALNVEEALTYDELEQIDFEAVGRQLIASGKGEITEFGMLFKNAEIPFEEFYDGQVFPGYIYEECLVIAKILFQEKTEYAYLPCEEISIDKALCRLHAPNIKECVVTLSNHAVDNQKWFGHFNDILESEGLYAVNRLAKEVNGFTTSEEWEKLSAVAKFVNVQDSKSLVQLVMNRDSFIFIPDIDNQEELARYWIEHNEEYELSPDLEDFFLYEQFGEQIEIYTKGKFLPSGGFVWIDGGQSFDEIMKKDMEENVKERQENEQENMTMGGI